MTAPADRPPSGPILLDDDWVPPPEPNRFPAYVTIVVAGACAILLTIGAAVWVFDQGRFGKDPEANSYPWSPIESAHVPSVFDTQPSRVIAAPVSALSPVRQVAAAPSRRPAFLSINSKPWAELSLDGHTVGNTPVLKIQVTAGRHQIVFTRDGFQPQRRWITVAPGATLRITDVELKGVAP